MLGAGVAVRSGPATGDAAFLSGFQRPALPLWTRAPRPSASRKPSPAGSSPAGGIFVRLYGAQNASHAQLDGGHAWGCSVPPQAAASVLLHKATAWIAGRVPAPLHVGQKKLPDPPPTAPNSSPPLASNKAARLAERADLHFLDRPRPPRGPAASKTGLLKRFVLRSPEAPRGSFFIWSNAFAGGFSHNLSRSGFA